jgi:hypothetical protein
MNIERMARRIDYKRELPRLRREFPILMMSAVDELDNFSIAHRLHSNAATVADELATERKAASTDPYFLELLVG